jgi:hypothetical protein
MILDAGFWILDSDSNVVWRKILHLIRQLTDAMLVAQGVSPGLMSKGLPCQADL